MRFCLVGGPRSLGPHVTRGSRMFRQSGSKVEKKRKIKEHFGGRIKLNSSPFSSPHGSPSTSTRNSRGTARSWLFPHKLKKKFERTRGRVGSTSRYDIQPCPAIAEAFQDPSTHKNPYAHSPLGSYGGPINFGHRLSSSYFELEIHDEDYLHEPRYLDLFEPEIQVIRDPNLDNPRRRTYKQMMTKYFRGNYGDVISPKICFGFIFFFVITLLIIVMVSAIVSFIINSSTSDPRINHPDVFTATTCGLVFGKVVESGFVFRGVPYAVQPVGKRRFMPAKVQNRLEDCWISSYSANVTKLCWQYDLKGIIQDGHEDCLLLDIFTPQLGYDNPLPVVVYIGGQTLADDSSRRNLLSEASVLSKKRQVVIVSPQIRRGLFGSFPSPLVAEESYPHTAGGQLSSDLFASLVWVQNNIVHFGGDKNKVTLLAHQSIAAVSWGLLSYPKFRKLVHSLWLSGAAPLHPFIWRDAKSNIKRPFNCRSMSCLYKKSAREVMESVVPNNKKVYDPWLVADGVYIPFDEEPSFMPIMFGSTEQVSASRLYSWHKEVNNVSAMKSTLESIFKVLHASNINPVWKRRFYYYPSNISYADDVRSALKFYTALKDNPWLLFTTLVSDATTTCPLLQKAASLARKWDLTVPSSRKFTPPIYSYLSRYQRATPHLMGLADDSSDIEAIMNVFKCHSNADVKYVEAMQNLFFTFIHAGVPERYYPTPAHHGIYVVGEEISIQKSRHFCQFWDNRTSYGGRF